MTRFNEWLVESRISKGELNLTRRIVLAFLKLDLVLNECRPAILALSDGALVCRGTVVGKHWTRRGPLWLRRFDCDAPTVRLRH